MIFLITSCSTKRVENNKEYNRRVDSLYSHSNPTFNKFNLSMDVLELRRDFLTLRTMQKTLRFDIDDLSRLTIKWFPFHGKSEVAKNFYKNKIKLQEFFKNNPKDVDLLTYQNDFNIICREEVLCISEELDALKHYKNSFKEYEKNELIRVAKIASDKNEKKVNDILVSIEDFYLVENSSDYQNLVVFIKLNNSSKSKIFNKKVSTPISSYFTTTDSGLVVEKFLPSTSYFSSPWSEIVDNFNNKYDLTSSVKSIELLPNKSTIIKITARVAMIDNVESYKMTFHEKCLGQKLIYSLSKKTAQIKYNIKPYIFTKHTEVEKKLLKD